mgnify:CR=1 FL=1
MSSPCLFSAAPRLPKCPKPSARAKAKSISLPGPATSSAARPTRTMTGSPRFEKETGCKVNVKTAATSDEMVTLMNQGGFDLVTASGDASLALGRRQEGAADQHRPRFPSWKTVDERLQDAPWHTVDGVHYGVPYQWGPERARLQYGCLQGGAQELVGGVRGADTCPTARATRGACRPMTARSTSPTPPST